MAADANVEVVLSLVAQLDQLEASMNAAATHMETSIAAMEQTVKGHFDNIDKRVTETSDHFKTEGERAGKGYAAGILLIGAALGAAFIESLRRSVTQITEMAVNLGTLSAVSGNTRGQIQQFQYALGQLGIPANHIQLMLVQLQARVTQLGLRATQTATGPLHQLGLSVSQLANKDAITQIEIIADKIKNLSPQQQVAATRELFGYRGAPLVAMLSQGSEGVKRYMEAFKPIPDSVLDSFVRLDMATKALQATWQAFTAQMLQPVIDGITKLIEKTTDFINKLRSISREAKMEILIASLAAGALAFEQFTSMIGSFFVQMNLFRGVIAILQDFAIPLRIIATLIILIAADWSSNWGNVRGIVFGLLAVITTFVTNVRAALMALWQVVGPILMKAWSDLGKAVADAGVEFGRMLNALLNNKLVLAALSAAVLLVVGIIYAMIEILTGLIRGLTFAELAIRLVADILSGVFNTAIALSIDAIGNLVQAFADAAKSAPIFGDAVAGAAERMAIRIRRAGWLAHNDVKATDKDIQNTLKDLQNLSEGKGLGSGAGAPSWWKFPKGGKGAPTTPSGDEKLTPDQGKTTSKVPAWLDALKDKLIPFDEAVKKAQFVVDELGLHIKLLGEITSIDKLNAAMSYTAKEAVANNDEISKQQAKLKELVELRGEIAAKLHEGGMAEKDIHSLKDEDRTLANDELTTQKAITELKVKNVDLIKEAYDVQKKYADDIASDEFSSYSEKEAAYEELYNWAVKINKVWADSAFIKFLDELKASSDEAKSLADSQAKLVESAGKGVAAGAKAPGAAGKYVSEIIAAEDDLTAAKIREKAAEEAVIDMNNRYVQALRHANGQVDNPEVQKAYGDLLNAQVAQRDAVNATTQAMLQLKSAQTAVTTEVDAELLKLAQQVGGPVYHAFQGLSDFLNGDLKSAATNLTQAFIMIFQKTLAYKDVEVAIMEVTDSLAKIFNVLRPVLDFFLGIIIGITNVFIAMYDVIADLLDVLGLNIQKIKLLNSDLQNLNQVSAPLIQIVHDLPTLNEYNSGVWGQLVAQQNAANNNLNNLNGDILQGFDKTMGKLGEIVGILLAIKVILGVAMGQSITGSITSTLQQITGFFNKMFGGASQAINPNSFSQLGQQQMQQIVQTFGGYITKYGTATTQVVSAAQQGLQAATKQGLISEVDKIASTGQQIAATGNQTAATGQTTAATAQTGNATTFTTAVTEFLTAVQEFMTGVQEFMAGSFLGGVAKGFLGGGAGVINPGDFSQLGSAMSMPSAGGLTDAVKNALNEWSSPLNLTSLYGLGRPLVAGGAGGGGGSSTSFSGPMVSVSFGDMYGLDEESVRNKLQPVFDQFIQDFMYTQQRQSRSGNYTFTRGIGASV